jgi:hypothetical protein
MWHVWGEGRCMQGFVRKNAMERNLLEDSRRQENNIKMDLYEKDG